MSYNKVFSFVLVVVSCSVVLTFLGYRLPPVQINIFNPVYLGPWISPSHTAVPRTCSCLLNKTCVAETETQDLLPYLHWYTSGEARQCFTRIAENSRKKLVLAYISDYRLTQTYEATDRVFDNTNSRELGRTSVYGIACNKSEGLSLESDFVDEGFMYQHLYDNFNKSSILDLIDNLTSICSTNPPSHPYLQCPHFIVTTLYDFDALPCEPEKYELLERYRRLMKSYATRLQKLAAAGVKVIYKTVSPVFEPMFKTKSLRERLQRILELQRKDAGFVYHYMVTSMFQGSFEKLRLDMWNGVAKETMMMRGIDTWNSGEAMAELRRKECKAIDIESRTVGYCGNGYGYSEDVLEHEVQILLNYMCNTHMKYENNLLFCLKE